jgi:choloylglycine hydrolase
MRRFAPVLALLILLTAGEVRPCSDMKLPLQSIPGSTSNVVSARTMDFSLQFDSQLAFVPKGHEFRSFMWGKEWTADHTFVGVNVFPWASTALMRTQKMFCDGMNDAGLSAAILWLSTSKIPGDASQSKAIFIMDVVGWILSKYATAREVYEAFSKADPEAQVWFLNLKVGPLDLRTPEHVVVHDANNESVVLEWLNGAYTPSMWTSWQTGDPYVGVMTNDPNYDLQRQNLIVFGNDHPSVTNVDPYDVDRRYFREGEGMLGLPGDHTPRSRFVRLNYLNRYVTLDAPSGSGMDPALWRVNQALRLIGHADGVLGEMYHNDDMGPYFFTLWTLVRDHTNMKIYYTGARNQSIKVVDLAKEMKNRKVFSVIGDVDQPMDPPKMAPLDASSSLYALASETGGKLSLAVSTAIPDEAVGRQGIDLCLRPAEGRDGPLLDRKGLEGGQERSPEALL